MVTFADFYIRVSARANLRFVLTTSSWDADESLIRRRENLGFSHAKNRRFFSTVHEIEDFVAWYKDISMSFIFMN